MHTHLYKHVCMYVDESYTIAQRSVELLFVWTLAMPIGKFPELVDGTLHHSLYCCFCRTHVHTHTGFTCIGTFVCATSYTAPTSQPTDLMKLVSISNNKSRLYMNEDT